MSDIPVKNRGAHVTHCYKNPNRKEINRTISINRTHERININCNCIKCGDMFVVSTTRASLDSGKFKKHCSYKCANSRNHSDKTKQKIAKSLTKNFCKPSSVNGHLKGNIDIFNLSFCYCGELKSLNKKFCSIVCRGHSKDYKQKISNISKERYRNFPEKHPNRICAGLIESYPEKMLRLYLELNDLKPDIDFIQQYNIGSYFVDFYLPKINLILEVDGEYWHKDKMKEQKRDEYIKNYHDLVHFAARPLIKKEYQSVIDNIIANIKTRE